MFGRINRKSELPTRANFYEGYQVRPGAPQMSSAARKKLREEKLARPKSVPTLIVDYFKMYRDRGLGIPTVEDISREEERPLTVEELEGYKQYRAGLKNEVEDPIVKMDFETEAGKYVAYMLNRYADRDEMLEPQLKALRLLENSVDNLTAAYSNLIATIDNTELKIPYDAELSTTEGNRLYVENMEFTFELNPQADGEESPVCIQPDGLQDTPYF